MGKYNKKIQKMLCSIKSKINSSGSASSKKSSENTALKMDKDINLNNEDDLVLLKTLETEKSTEDQKEISEIFPIIMATTSSATKCVNKKYVSPEQLGEFCDDLHTLLEDIKNIHNYVQQIGAYPKSLADRLNEEVTEVSLLLAEAEHVRGAIRRTQEQRKAVKDYANGVCTSVIALRKEEAKELEQRLKVADAELFKCWEGVRESTDIGSFDTLLSEVKSQQLALDTVMKLVQNKVSQIRNSTPLSSQSDC